MRLIDADKLKEEINSSLNTGRETFSPEIIYEAVYEQPTVFDVDEVVERLKQLKMRHFLTITGDADKDCAYKNIANTIDRVIEIIKGGGVE